MLVRQLKLDKGQFGDKVGRHMLEFGRDPRSADDRKWLMEYTLDIYSNATQFRGGTFSGQGALTASGANARGAVWFYAKGDDGVVTDKFDNFVTILKGGVGGNTSFRQATLLTRRP